MPVCLIGVCYFSFQQLKKLFHIDKKKRRNKKQPSGKEGEDFEMTQATNIYSNYWMSRDGSEEERDDGGLK